MIVVFELNNDDKDYFNLIREISYDEMVREIGEPYLHRAYTDSSIAWLGRRYAHPDNKYHLYLMDIRTANVKDFFPDDKHRVMIENLRNLRIKYLTK